MIDDTELEKQNCLDFEGVWVDATDYDSYHCLIYDMEYECPDSGCYDEVFGYCASWELCDYYDPDLMFDYKRTQDTDTAVDLSDLGDILDLGDLGDILDPDALEA